MENNKMIKLKLMDKETSKKYQSFKSTDGIIRSSSLSVRAGKGSVVPGKENYSKKHDALFKQFMEV